MRNEIRWERIRLGVHKAYDPLGREIAQIVHIIGTEGRSTGWSVYIIGDYEPLEGLHPTEAAARQAAESSLRRRET
jgi:hypothetical protein